MKYYLSDYGNITMKLFMLRMEGVEEDDKGIFVREGELYKELQNQFDMLEYFKSIGDFINFFDFEYYYTFFGTNYYVRVIEDDFENIFSLIYVEDDGFENVVEIKSGDVVVKNTVYI